MFVCVCCVCTWIFPFSHNMFSLEERTQQLCQFLYCLFFDVACYTCNDDDNDNDDKTLPSFNMYEFVPMILLCKWLNWFFLCISGSLLIEWHVLFSYFNQTTTGSMMLSLILKYRTTNEICLYLHWQWACICSGICFPSYFFLIFCCFTSFVYICFSRSMKKHIMYEMNIKIAFHSESVMYRNVRGRNSLK